MFTTKLEKTLPELRAFTRMLCGSADLADDIVQNACLKAWKARSSFDPERGSFKSWIFTIARNEYLQILRKRRPVDCYAPEDFEHHLVQDCQHDTRTDCSDAIKQLFELNAEQRDVFILVAAAGYSYEEAAEICGCSIGTIKSRVNRARAKLLDLRDAQASNGQETISFHALQDLLGYVDDLVRKAA